MRIGELSAATGVDIETVRYYEKRGLLPAPARRRNGYRSYNRTHVERLAFIRHCRALDMPLADVQSLLELIARPESACGDVDGLIDAHLRRVQERLSSLRALEQELRGLRARCGAQDRVEACGIVHELLAAADPADR